MNAIAISPRFPTAVSTRIQRTSYWVSRPPSLLASDVRLLLLVEHFGYTYADVDAFVLETGFRIVDTRTPDEEATRAQMEGWKMDPQRRIEITLTDFWVQRIETFRAERIARAVALAGAQIGDLALRRVFVDAMTAVLGKSDQERTTAFLNLINAITGSTGARGTLSSAFETLEVEGYEDNPFISLARARLAIERWKVEAGPGLDSDVVNALAQTSERLKDATLSRTAGTVLGDADVAVLNQEMSRVNAEIGNEEESVRRAWIARFASMRPEERARYREGSVVSIVPPGTKFMTAPSKSDRELDALDENWTERQRMEEEIRQIGNPKPRNADRSDYFSKDFDEPISIEGSTRTKRRGGATGYQPKYKPSTSSITLRSPNGLATYKSATGGLDLVILVLQMIGADRRMNELAEYTRQREAIVRRVTAENTRAMPPKPERIRALIRDLLDVGSRTRDDARKQEIQRALSGLRSLLEESRAAWPGQ